MDNVRGKPKRRREVASLPSDESDRAEDTKRRALGRFGPQVGDSDQTRNDQYEPNLQSTQYSASESHYYGPSSIGGNAQVQYGNARYILGSGSQLNGPSIVSGNMNVHHTTYYTSESKTIIDPGLELKKTLYYETMESRRAQIDRIENTSFDWIWTHTAFPEWLESDHGLFWICGKPASGKSTLVNHLANSSAGSARVRSHLQTVEKQPPLVIHFFFDFRAGAGIANTVCGMLRSLLLQLVEKSASIKNYVLEKTAYRVGGQWPELELELVDIICGALEYQSFCVCGFIDGLDEYIGSLLKLVDMFVLLQKRSGMKICLASRPGAELDHKLSEMPSFLMQDHNVLTIASYVDAAFSQLTPYASQGQLERLGDSILTEAHGVILWARFATDEVASAILGGCTADEISIRLASFPTDLGSVYERILNRLDPAHELQANVMLFIILNWRPSGLDEHESFRYRPLTVHDLLYTLEKLLHWLGPHEPSVATANREVTRCRRWVSSRLNALVSFEEEPCEEEPFDLIHSVVPVTHVSLSHKTVEAFIQKHARFCDLSHRISDILSPVMLQPMMHLQIVLAASYMSRQHFEDNEVTEGCSVEQRCKILERILSIEKLSDTPWARQVEDSLDGFCRARCLDTPEYADVLIKSSQSPFVQHYIRHHTSLWSFLKYLPQSSFRYPEMCLFINNLYEHAFCALWNHVQQFLTAKDVTSLFLYFLSNQRSTIETRSSLLISHHSKPDHPQSPVLGIMRCILQRLTIGARALPLLIVREQDFRPLRDNLFNEVSTPFNNGSIVCEGGSSQMNDWYFDKIHILRRWAISPSDLYDESFQIFKLQELLLLGVDINGRVGDVGDVLAALFEPVAWRSTIDPIVEYDGRVQYNESESCFPGEEVFLAQPHFSKAKFDALIASGYLCKPEKCKTCLSNAQKLSNALRKDIKKFWFQTRRVETTIKELDEYAIPYLRSRIEEAEAEYSQ